MKDWCLGFIFANEGEHVIMLRKSRTMHVDLWNGVGGKIENGETALEAMIRECKEETGLSIDNWAHVGFLTGSDTGNPWRVHVYAAEVPLEKIDEITADWAVNAEKDKPYRISVGDLSYMKMAPHAETLAIAARNKLRHPNNVAIQLIEVG